TATTCSKKDAWCGAGPRPSSPPPPTCNTGISGSKLALMGNLATPEVLLHRWEEMQRDPSLRDLPYKIELNAWGKVEMSPASVRHGQLQAALAAQFTRQLANG